MISLYIYIYAHIPIYVYIVYICICIYTCIHVTSGILMILNWLAPYFECKTAGVMAKEILPTASAPTLGSQGHRDTPLWMILRALRPVMQAMQAQEIGVLGFVNHTKFS